jgi:hypothetical protein
MPFWNRNLQSKPVARQLAPRSKRTNSGPVVNLWNETILPPVVEVLVVAGGASGARSNTNGSGGGGAGGYLEGFVTVHDNVSYQVTIGAGGASRTVQSNGAAGSNSQFWGTATGGGGGGVNAGLNGGSGGGAGNNSVTEGLANQANSQGLTGYGNNGAESGDGGFGGGGGGAGGAGGPAGVLSPDRRNGGVGRSTSITGSSVTYATGGAYTGGTTAGGANTGDGGSGSYQLNSGAGGSGIVVIRYPDYYSDITTIGAGLTHSKTQADGYKIYSFTSGSDTITI